MVLYSCPRCLYSTKQRRDIRKHFHRKKPCRIVAEDKSIEECIQEVLGDNTQKTLKSLKNPSFSLKNSSKTPQNPSISLIFPQSKTEKLLNSLNTSRRIVPDTESSDISSTGDYDSEIEKTLNLRETLKSPSFPSKKSHETILGESLRENYRKNTNQNHKSPNKDNENINTCHFCNRSYSRKDNLARHIKICKDRPSVAANNVVDKPDSVLFGYDKNQMVTYEQVQKLLEAERQREREKSEFIIGKLESQIEVLLKNQGSNNTHTTNYNIMINSFGKENLDYISNDYINKLIESGPLNSIPTLLKYIHFNPEHKENHNVKISNKKENLAQIFNGISWEYRDKKETISDMSDRAFNIINTHYQNGNNSYMNDFKVQYEENNKNVHKRVFKDTEIMILNNQKLV